MENVEKYLIAGKSTLNLFGDYFITLNDFQNILLSPPVVAKAALIRISSNARTGQSFGF